MLKGKSGSGREGRLGFRATIEQITQIEHCARALGITTTALVLGAATEYAEMSLGQPRRIVMESEEWDEFAAALQGPATPVPSLVALLDDPDLRAR